MDRPYASPKPTAPPCHESSSGRGAEPVPGAAVIPRSSSVESPQPPVNQE